ncbi:MAG: hypothetical protein CSA66_02795 [Proteobacteria bacterium]|nr:MAG: hypothetical protein CSA66_02795 [Pseudomonadota bacterium]
MACRTLLARLALGLALLTACVSNPTPHPGAQDGAVALDLDVPAEEEQRGTCEDLGGQWDDDDHLCAMVAPNGAGADVEANAGPPAADLVAIEITGAPGAYDFAVLIASDDASCDQYADWWEIVRADATLAYRGVFDGPHLDPQPFSATATAVDVAADTLLIIRAHLEPAGYVGLSWFGSVGDGFTRTRVSAEFAAALETTEPLPTSCTE